jgi:hypothetical integral membrane protein (TIGR02206 family)
MRQFELFGATYWITLSFIFTLGYILIRSYRSKPDRRNSIRYGLAVCTLSSYPLHILLAFIFSYQISLESLIPLHLCDLAAIIGGIALCNKSYKLAEIAYFWGLAGTLQGLITPDIKDTFPSPEFISFYWNHGFVVITALFLPLAMGWRPRRNAYWYLFGISQLYLIVALSANYLLKTNYGYLFHKPKSASLMDYFPTWPWYILVLEALCLLIFFLLHLPFSHKSQK